MCYKEDMIEININEKAYPKLLGEIHSPPKKLYGKGDASVLQKTCISIVGTRFCSDYGEYVTEKIIKELAVLDVVIVSGLAKGIDTIAHRAALKNGLKTIAVFGSGLNHIYPKENIKLAQEIERNGIIISEYPEFHRPFKMNFPQRNRIISGLSLGTVVTEAPDKSGALITADFALDQGREIFAVPGDIDRKGSLGTLKLIRNGAAHPISSGEEIIEVIRKTPLPFTENPVHKNEDSELKNFINNQCKLSAEEKLVLNSMSIYRGSTLDKIVEKSGLSIQKTLTALSYMEINGLVKSINGKFKIKKSFMKNL